MLVVIAVLDFLGIHFGELTSIRLANLTLDDCSSEIAKTAVPVGDSLRRQHS